MNEMILYKNMWKHYFSWKSTILFIILVSIFVWVWNWDQCRKDTKYLIDVAEKNGKIMSASFQHELWLLDWDSVTRTKMTKTRTKTDAANEISIAEKAEEEDIENKRNVTSNSTIKEEARKKVFFGVKLANNVSVEANIKKVGKKKTIKEAGGRKEAIKKVHVEENISNNLSVEEKLTMDVEVKTENEADVENLRNTADGLENIRHKMSEEEEKETVPSEWTDKLMEKPSFTQQHAHRAVERAITTTSAGATGPASGGDETWRPLAAVGSFSGGEESGPAASDLPWFMKDGRRHPLPAVRSQKTGRRLARIWPQEAPNSDRITDQLMFVPPLPDDPGTHNTQPSQRAKKILIYYTINRKRRIRKEISLSMCPVNSCTITYEKEAAPHVDLIVFKNYFDYRLKRSSVNQVWVHYAKSAPTRLTALFNWTATFRHDSDIVVPHAKWVYYDEAVQQNYVVQKNYTRNKSKKVVWFSRNCLVSTYQLQYVKELQKYIDVEMHDCGIKSPRRVKSHLKILGQDYKFIIIFETLNCVEYITKEFYENGLRYGMIPIVMGARPEDYAQSAPYRSYIHVDDFESARDLAEYLLRLDADDDLYNSYFRWKGTGEFINTYFFCRLCAMLHDDFPVKSYNISEWWNNNFACVKETWRNSSFHIL